MKASEQINEVENLVGVGWLEAVRQRIASIRFGAVEIVVHDGRVVQIETKEKIRLERVEN